MRIPSTAVLGTVITVAVVLACVFAPLLTRHTEAQLIGGVWDPPGGATLLGTDALGRDMLARLLYGGRTSIGIAFVTAVLAFVLGVAGGCVAAVLGGWTDAVLGRIAELFLAVPLLIYALMVLTVLGTSIPVMVSTIAVLEAARIFRVARAVAANLAVLDYVQVARVRGEGLAWILRREILPNALPPLIADFGLRFCFVFLFVAALSFLGLGIQPPAADWGSMVRENAQAISFGIYAPLYPAGAIALLTVGVNLIVDWLLARHALPAGTRAEL